MQYMVFYHTKGHILRAKRRPLAVYIVSPHSIGVYQAHEEWQETTYYRNALHLFTIGLCLEFFSIHDEPFVYASTDESLFIIDIRLEFQASSVNFA